jgi:hypothetical protein
MPWANSGKQDFRSELTAMIDAAQLHAAGARGFPTSVNLHTTTVVHIDMLGMSRMVMFVF